MTPLSQRRHVQKAEGVPSDPPQEGFFIEPFCTPTSTSQGKPVRLGISGADETGGRIKGTPNKATVELKELLHAGGEEW
jgi:hypothetical protein